MYREVGSLPLDTQVWGVQGPSKEDTLWCYSRRAAVKPQTGQDMRVRRWVQKEKKAFWDYFHPQHRSGRRSTHTVRRNEGGVGVKLVQGQGPPRR